MQPRLHMKIFFVNYLENYLISSAQLLISHVFGSCTLFVISSFYNPPAVLFISMMHNGLDLKAIWMDLRSANNKGVPASENEGTNIIVDDIFVYFVSEDYAGRCVRQ